MFEHRSKPVIPPHRFIARLARSGGIAVLLVGLSLALGMAGYHQLEQLSWLDAFLNAAMLLGGMGPVTTPLTDAGKLFAGCYALYCGLVFILAASVILAPIAHRILHKLHVDDDNH